LARHGRDPILVVAAFVVFDPFEIGTVLSENFSELVDDPVPGTLAVLALWSLAAVHAKRLRDRDHSAWWLLAPAFLLAFCALLAAGEPPRLLLAAGALITLIPTVWLIAEAGFHPGSEAENRFGPVPVSKFPAAKPHVPTGGEVATAAIKGILWSPFGLIIVLPLQLIMLLLAPFRGRHAFFGFHGRIGRKNYWQLGLIALFIALFPDVCAVWIAAYFAGRTTDEMEGSPMIRSVHLLFIGLGIWAFAALSGKRLHDRNRRAWWMLGFIPLFATPVIELWAPGPTLEAIFEVILLISLPFVLWFWVELGFLKGTQGPNRFGPNPIAPPPPVPQGATA
jgi:uncharacterized membrane protein YhaH (DUF805 family)